MRKLTEESDVIAVAYLFAEGMKQVDIAERLDLAEATVSRLLAAAEKNYLKIDVKVLESRISPEEKSAAMLRISRHDIQAKLKELSGQPILVRVFPSGARGKARRVYEKRLNEFSRRAAPLVRSLLDKTKYCGVAWGMTLGSLIAAIEKQTPPVYSPKNFEAFPICGEPIVDEPELSSSSGLASMLQSFMKGKRAQPYSLYAVPAFIPKVIGLEKLGVIRELIGNVNSYRHIFGDPAKNKEDRALDYSTLAAKANMILTSVGPADRPVMHGNVLLSSKVDTEWLSNVVRFEIAGVCVGKPGLSPSDSAKLGELNQRWTGIELKHFVACANRARSAQNDEHPGVVVVSIGANKARYALEAVRMGIVNTLLIDDDLQKEIARLASKRGEFA